jgi:hypothetical protein
MSLYYRYTFSSYCAVNTHRLVCKKNQLIRCPLCTQNVEFVNVKLVVYIVTTDLCRHLSTSQYQFEVQHHRAVSESTYRDTSIFLIETSDEGWCGGWRRSENMKSCQYKSLFVSFLRITGPQSSCVFCVQVSDDKTALS